MARSEYHALLNGSGDVNKSGLLNALEERSVYVIKDAEDPEDLDSGDIQALFYTGILFWRDDSDSTTAHDGVTCIVTNDGVRFKADAYDGRPSRFYVVKDKDLATPPGSPAVGDAYIVASSPTGAWTGHAKHIASYTARGWRFIVPARYDAAFVIDELLYYHFNASDVWTSGLPALVIANDSISQQKFKYGKFGTAVENQTTNTPPGSPSDGDAYIVGGAPTGAWVGQSKNIAVWETSAWVFYTAKTGYLVFDKGLNTHVRFVGGVWVGLISGYAKVATATASTTDSVARDGNIGNYTYSDTVGPIIGTNTVWLDTLTINFAAQTSGSVLEIFYSVHLTNTAISKGSSATIAVFRDTDVNSLDHMRLKPADASTGTTPVFDVNNIVQFEGTFLTTSPDTNSHTYKFRAAGSNVSSNITFGRRRIIIREIAQ